MFNQCSINFNHTVAVCRLDRCGQLNARPMCRKQRLARPGGSSRRCPATFWPVPGFRCHLPMAKHHLCTLLISTDLYWYTENRHNLLGYCIILYTASNALHFHTFWCLPTSLTKIVFQSNESARLWAWQEQFWQPWPCVKMPSQSPVSSWDPIQCKMMQNDARWCKMHIAKYCKVLQSIAKYCSDQEISMMCNIVQLCATHLASTLSACAPVFTIFTWDSEGLAKSGKDKLNHCVQNSPATNRLPTVFQRSCKHVTHVTYGTAGWLCENLLHGNRIWIWNWQHLFLP